jgi:hypothetical protein
MQTKYALLISLLITLGTIIFQLATFGSGKLFTIIGSLGSRLFILIPLVAVLTGCIHLIHLFCKPNPYLVLSFFLLLFAYGVRAAFSTKLTETTIITDKIPHDLKLMLVADFHVDDILSTVHLKELKRQIQLQQPDLVLIAGDFFNRANVRQAEYYKVLA